MHRVGLGLTSGAVWEAAVGGMHDRTGRKPSASVAAKRRCCGCGFVYLGECLKCGRGWAGAAVNSKWFERSWQSSIFFFS
jgi:hypothetical protein